MKNIAVRVENISKTFTLPHEKVGSVKSALTGWAKRRKGYESQHVIKNLSFEIEKGDFFGIVGRNGSGKSTLLKIMSQIYSPDSGRVIVNGSLIPFIELGVGFNPELTGRENVYLNGALLGFSRIQTEAIYHDIVEFAELENFMDQKLKNYSSGMQVRLAFSIAIQADGDILLLDEVLAVGDEAFQRKCNDYFEQLKKNKKTVILVTHDMDAVRRYCNKALMIHNGEMVAYGSPEDVSGEYSIANLDEQPLEDAEKESNDNQSLVDEFKVELLSPKKINQDGEVLIKYTVKTDRDAIVNIAMDLQNMDNNAYVFSGASEPRLHRKNIPTEHVVKFKVNHLNDMNVRVNSTIRDEKNDILAFIWNEGAPNFIIRRDDYLPGKRTQFSVLFDTGEWLK